MESRVRELERRQSQSLRRIESLESRLAQAEQTQNKMGGFAAPAGGGGSRGRIARATTAIGASDEHTPGGGTVQPMKLVGGNYDDVGDPIAVKNAGSAISEGKRCSYWLDPEGVIWVEPEECEDVEEEE